MLAGFFSLPLIVLLGEASYGLYILHYPVWDIVNHLVAHIDSRYNPHGVPFFLFYLTCVVGLSILSLFLLEQPARRAIRRLLAKRPLPPLGQTARAEPS